MSVPPLTVSILLPVEAQDWQERDECYDEDVATDLVTEYGDRLPRGTAIMVKRASGEVTWLGVADNGAVEAADPPDILWEGRNRVGWLARWSSGEADSVVETLAALSARLTVRACLALLRLCVVEREDAEVVELVAFLTPWAAGEGPVEEPPAKLSKGVTRHLRACEKRMEKTPTDQRAYHAAWGAFAVGYCLFATGEDLANWGRVAIGAIGNAMKKARVRRVVGRMGEAARSEVPLGVALLAARATVIAPAPPTARGQRPPRPTPRP